MEKWHFLVQGENNIGTEVVGQGVISQLLFGALYEQEPEWISLQVEYFSRKFF